MNKMFAAFALAGALLLAAPAANAAVQTFGDFTVDVPDGWTASKADNGCMITKNDKSSNMAIMSMAAEGATPDQIAAEVAKQFTNPQTKKDNGTVIVSGKVNGVDTVTVIGGDSNKVGVVTMSGSDMEGMSKIAGTVKDK